MMLGILLSVLVLAAQIHYGVIGHDGIHGRILSAFGPYFILIACVAIYHAARTPWLISNEHLDSIKALEGEKTALHQELEDIKRIPPAIEVRIVELYRRPVNYGRVDNPKNGLFWDIFLSAWVELKSPSTLSIREYRMQLSLHGNRISLPAQDDLNKWQLDIWKPHGELARAELTSLPLELTSGEPIEGWLHFASEQATTTVLDQCSVRLIADWGHGKTYKEQSPLWNPNSDKRFSQKS